MQNSDGYSFESNKKDKYITLSLNFVMPPSWYEKKAELGEVDDSDNEDLVDRGPYTPRWIYKLMKVKNITDKLDSITKCLDDLEIDISTNGTLRQKEHLVRQMRDRIAQSVLGTRESFNSQIDKAIVCNIVEALKKLKTRGTTNKEAQLYINVLKSGALGETEVHC